MTFAAPSSHQQDSGAEIAKKLTEKSANYKRLIAGVLYWTGKEPYFTQMLCKLITEVPDTPPEGSEVEWVDGLVRSRWLENWEEVEDLKPLRQIRDRLVAPKPHNIELLKEYKRILARGGVRADRSSPQKELRLLGLVAQNQGVLTIRSRLHKAIFSRAWVDRTLTQLENGDKGEEGFLSKFAELERKLLVSQVDILAQAELGQEDQEAGQTLYNVLGEVTATVSDILKADRTTIFLLNDEKTELWSLVAQGGGEEFLDIQVRIGEGIAGQVAAAKKIIHIPDNVYNDARSRLVKEFDKKYNYHTQNILAFPILNDDGELVAVIQLLNKLAQAGNSHQGFTALDIEHLAKCVVPIRRILGICQSCYQATKKLRATAALNEATRSLDRINLDSTAALQRIMDAAQKLMNADRSTLWVVDAAKGDLWTEIPGGGEIRCEIGTGFAGQVAKTRKPTIIPFDLYNNPNAENAKKIDEKTHYRTCSLLCLPVFSPEGKLLGVTQLVNKRKPGVHPNYDPAMWPEVPDYFKASFDRNDRASMQVFNERVGVILQYIQQHQSLKQQQDSPTPQNTIQQALQVCSTTFATAQPYESVYAMLNFLNLSLRRLLNSQHSHIFLVNPVTQKLELLFPIGEMPGIRRLSLSLEEGLSQAIVQEKAIKVNNNVNQLDDKLLISGIRPQQRARSRHILLCPILNTQQEVIAIVRLINKLRSPLADNLPLDQQIATDGFTQNDADLLLQQQSAVLPMLQACQSFYLDAIVK
ncbi:MAG: GAF domain-containing protein [Jaaginema sp. PMC 1079.18]|nr:GAF domain-containing protein [Jaaginema sp. PMC 1080.18]MEC4852499.1 GAF domain-containing protein [Jaaginema sp. PMC 1079.18]MEC4868708.1 GAF domain-containing protein [Jaaginema sp. PMC 1078.18]